VQVKTLLTLFSLQIPSGSKLTNLPFRQMQKIHTGENEEIHKEEEVI
jgi:hypothetical protein